MSDAPRTRSRAALATAHPVANPAANPVRQGTGDTAWMKTGMDQVNSAFDEEAKRRAQAAEERAKRQFTPWRYSIDVKGKYNPKTGTTGIGEGHIIVLDHQLGPVIEEHERWDPATGKYTWETCPGKWEYCPLCENGTALNFKRSYPVMMLSIVDLRPVTFTKGDRAGQTMPWTKKLLPVKQDQYGFFKRQFERHGTLRGLMLLMTRDTDKTLRSGNPEFVEMIPENELVDEFGNPEMKDAQGQIVKALNDDVTVFNYGRIFPKPTKEDLISRYGGTPPAGSTMDNNSAWGSHDPGQASPAPAQNPATPNGGSADATVATGAATPTPAAAPGRTRSRAAQAATAQPVTDPDDVPFD
jgi:hypothetical protein